MHLTAATEWLHEVRHVACSFRLTLQNKTHTHIHTSLSFSISIPPSSFLFNQFFNRIYLKGSSRFPIFVERDRNQRDSADSNRVSICRSDLDYCGPFPSARPPTCFPKLESETFLRGICLCLVPFSLGICCPASLHCIVPLQASLIAIDPLWLKQCPDRFFSERLFLPFFGLSTGCLSP